MHITDCNHRPPMVTVTKLCSLGLSNHCLISSAFSSRSLHQHWNSCCGNTVYTMNVGLEVEILKWNVRTHRHNFGPFKLTFILSPRSCQFSHGVDRLIGDPSSYVIAILPFVRSRRFEVLLPLLESLIQNRFT